MVVIPQDLSNGFTGPLMDIATDRIGISQKLAESLLYDPACFWWRTD